MKKVPVRKTDTEEVQVGDYFDGTKRYYDQVAETTVVKVLSGDCYVTDKKHEMLVTVLGSCVAACMRDPVTGIGGMNHFLLPASGSSVQEGEQSARFGAYAMEQLINEIIKLGGDKERLEVKVFGGGNVIKSSALIGDKNATFVKKFLQDEGLDIVSEDLGGKSPRRIHYYVDTGKIMMRKLQRKEDMRIIEEEQQYEEKLRKDKATEGDVELFG